MFSFCVPELPELFPLNEVAKALLRVPNGPWFICRLLVNFPDYFEQGKLCMRLLIMPCKRCSLLDFMKDLIITDLFYSMFHSADESRHKG
jgi:hypothetical protein